MSTETPMTSLDISVFDAQRVSETLQQVRPGRYERTVSGEVLEVRRDDGLVLVLHVNALAHAALEAYKEPVALGHVGIVLVGPPPDEALSKLPARTVMATLHSLDSIHALVVAIEGALERTAMRLAAERKTRSLRRYRYELGELVEIARALTRERDIDTLLDLILEKSRFITAADAGTIYVVETDAENHRFLRMKLSQNESVRFASGEFTVPVSTRSIAGAAVVAKRLISIPDVYSLGAEHPFSFDPSFDERVGYRTKSMITVPMFSVDGDVIGVIQLLNKKRNPERRLISPEAVEREVISFDERSEELLATLAAQAGIALENALLYQEISTIFDGFVRASVQAIEQRDPTTSGHSLRVSVLSCQLARVVDGIDEGPYRTTRFAERDLRQIEYAALLHDFGKIGVREEVLVKAKKLYPHEHERVEARFRYAAKVLEAEALRQKVELMARGAGGKDLAQLDELMRQGRTELDEAWTLICEANEPTVLTQGDFSRIALLGDRTFLGEDNEQQPLLTPHEVKSLQIRRGTLTSSEMEEIRSHVVHTFNFLSRIPWGKNFARVPRIAGCHHEKLNGSGYPHGIKSENIPVESKIMTIADIYDALTARDRPYKKAVPLQRALDILGFEVKDGNIDGELVRLFTEAEVYREVEKDLQY